MEQQPDYSKWSSNELINRVTSLEHQLKTQTQRTKSARPCSDLPAPIHQPKKARVTRQFNASKYSTRLIALKLAYLGQRYNGLEFHSNNPTPLPTVEEELWKALNKARLIFPTPNPLLEAGEPNWEGCEYSKCGRTDKGVSAFGQVLGIRVRSNRPLGRKQIGGSEEEVFGDRDTGQAQKSKNVGVSSRSIINAKESRPSTPQSPNGDSSLETPTFHPVKDELPYCQILNRLLPPDIRVLAWCPTPPPDFSARFSCKERQYRYFFTQPAFAPTTTTSAGVPPNQGASISASELERRREGWLDIEAMRIAAHKFAGLHDFRNFCKLDASKQIENFERRIFHSDIEPFEPKSNAPNLTSEIGSSLSENPSENASRHPNPSPTTPPSRPKIYTFTLHGSAFLWHQVRHMAAILFLIGQGLESPSLISTLLDIRHTPCKPQYEMASDAPLVLWDCIFPTEGSESRKDALEWVYANDSTECGKGGLVDDIWRVWRGRKMDEVLAGSLLDVIATQSGRKRDERDNAGGLKRSQKVFQGGDGPRFAGKYIPVMQKPKMESVEAINAKYAKRKGFEQSEEMREQGFRRVAADAGDAVGE